MYVSGSSVSHAFYLIFQHFGYHLDQEDIEALFFHRIGTAASKGREQFSSVLGVLKCLFGKSSTFKRLAPISCRLYPTLAEDLHGRVLIVDGELNPFFYGFGKTTLPRNSRWGNFTSTF